MTSVEAQPNIKAESPDDAGQQEVHQTNVDSVAKIKDEPMSQSSSDGPVNNNNNNTDADNNDDDADDSRDDNVNDDDDQCQDDGDHQNGIKNESMDENEKTNLIVNYLPQQMTDEEFEQLFTKFGNMKSCKIVRNRMTGYSYGFGFVDYDTHEQALNAIEELNGHEVDTKKIKVAFARPAGQDIKQANLYVKNVPNTWSQDDVKKVFEPYGQIIQVRVLGNNRGIAFVLFDLRKQAQDAMEALNGKQVDGCEEPFEIKFAADKKSEKRGNKTGGGAGAASGSAAGADGDKPPRRRERGNRGGRNRDRSRHNNNNNMNQGRGTSQGRGFNNNNNNGGGGRMFNRGGNNNSNNSNNNNNFNDNMNGGGVGPMRQQGNRMSRYAPFVPMQQAPMVPQAAAAPMNPYGYSQQPMMPYMMANHPAALMQMNPMAAAAHQQQQMHQMTNPYGAIGTMSAAQMGAIGYAQPAMTQQQPSAAVSNMYNVASSMMNNAAQMQPQLGQPMSMRGTGGNSATNSNSNSGGAGGGGGSSDGVTLFVYNIGPDSDDNELKTMFSPYGDVLRYNVVRKTPGGETKGFGFVTVRNTSQANAAIAGLNGQVKNGKPLQVSFKK